MTGRYRQFIIPLFLLTCGVASAAVSLRFYRDASSATDLFVDPINLGEVSWGNHDVDFILRNNTQFTAKIREVSVSCHCTHVRLPVEAMVSRSSLNGVVTWDTTGDDGLSSTTFHVNYILNGEARQLSIPVRAVVIPDYRIEPKFLKFRNGEDSEQVLKVVPVIDKNIQIQSFSASDHSVGVKLLTGDPMSLRVSYTPEKQANKQCFSTKIHITTSNKDFPVMTVPIYFMRQ